MTLSRDVCCWGMRSPLCSRLFFNADVECNVVSGWRNPEFLVIVPLIEEGDWPQLAIVLARRANHIHTAVIMDAGANYGAAGDAHAHAREKTVEETILAFGVVMDAAVSLYSSSSQDCQSQSIQSSNTE
jgi:hypothetical protein